MSEKLVALYYDAPLTSFMLSGFLYSARTLRDILCKTAYAEWQGLLQLIDLNLSEKQITQLKTWLECYPKLGRMVTQEEACEIAGIHIDGEAIHIPLAGCINTAGLCETLTQHKNIEVILVCEADELYFENKVWHMGEVTAPSLVITNGFQSNHFKQTRYLPIKPIRLSDRHKIYIHSPVSTWAKAFIFASDFSKNCNCCLPILNPFVSERFPRNTIDNAFVVDADWA